MYSCAFARHQCELEKVKAPLEKRFEVKAKSKYEGPAPPPHPQPENWDICPPRFSLASKVTLDMRPIWLRPTAVMALAGLPRYKVFELIEKRLVKVAYLFNQRTRSFPLTYGPSLWAYLDELATLPAPEPMLRVKGAGTDQKEVAV